MDRTSPETRSRVMRAVHSRETGPEILVGHYFHALGLRYRLHASSLPGTPDIVFPALRVAVFVHGCFWHRHEGCRHATTPSSRQDYWIPKFQRNVVRDRAAIVKLEATGWHPVVIWECETRTSRLAAIGRDLLARRDSLKNHQARDRG